jgi:hypothetical protein
MQAQVVHQRKATLPLLPMLLAALFVFATVVAVQIAIRDRGTNAPAVSTVDSGAIQKAAMVEAGITSLSGVATQIIEGTGGPHPRTKFAAAEGSGDGGGRDQALRATMTRIEQAR